jgi:hypothetical protein
MRLLIIGAAGNMGRRYTDIARSLDADVTGIDIGEPIGHIHPDVAIIATPTDTHYQLCLDMQRRGIPYLCEKPVCMQSVGKLEALTGYMVNNWAHVFYDRYLEPKQHEVTYDYFNTGPHGKLWDCIQLYHIARGIPTIRTNAREFTASIDERPVSLGDIQESYRRMLQSFLKKQESRLWTIRSTVPTHRMIQFITGGKRGHTDSGTEHIDETAR